MLINIQTKEASHKIIPIAWFHLCKIQKQLKPAWEIKVRPVGALWGLGGIHEDLEYSADSTRLFHLGKCIESCTYGMCTFLYSCYTSVKTYFKKCWIPHSHLLFSALQPSMPRGDLCLHRAVWLTLQLGYPSHPPNATWLDEAPVFLFVSQTQPLAWTSSAFASCLSNGKPFISISGKPIMNMWTHSCAFKASLKP